MAPVTRYVEVLAAAIAAIAAIESWAAGGVAPSAGAMGPQAEIQIGLCAPDDRIVQALGLHPRGTPMTVWQFDDDALTLLQRGLRLRLRVAADGSSELTLKVADQDCAHLDPKRVLQGEGKCEYDVYRASTAGAVSISRSLSAKDTKELLAGRLGPAQALSPSQARYLRQVFQVWPLPLEIRALGPMQVQRYRTTDKLYDVDMSRLPDDARYAEISRKVPLADAPRAMEALEGDLLKAGVAMCADQSSPAADKLRALVR